MRASGNIRGWAAGLICLVALVGASATALADDEPPTLNLIEAAEQVADSLAEVLRGQTVVVLDPRPFQQGRVGLSRLGRAMGTELRLALDQQRGVTVLEQASLDEALRELRLNLSDLFDPQHRQRFGRFTGTRLMVLAELLEGPRRIELVVRAVRLETGELLRDVSVFISKDAATYRLQGIDGPALIRLEVNGVAEVYMDGYSAGKTNRSGRLDLEVDAGRHRIEIKGKDHYWKSTWVEVAPGQTLDLRLRLKPLPDPDGVALRSMLIPGWGDLVLGHGDFWTYPVLFYGSLYGAKYYWDRRDELVTVQDPQTGRETVEKSGKWPTYGLLAVAAAVWIYDVGHVRASAKAVRRREETYRPQVLSMEVAPFGKGLLVSMQWSF